MSQARSLAYEDTIYSADSIEWCPSEGYQDIFACGTYQVIEPKNGESSTPADTEELADKVDDDEVEDSGPRQTERTGRLLLYRVVQDSEAASCQELQRIDTAAILDSKWSPCLSSGGAPILAVGDAKGAITIFELSKASRLVQAAKIQVDDPTTLCLSLDWSDRFSPLSTPPRLITSLSTGSLALLSPSPTGWEVEQKWAAHDYEPWITSFDQWDPNLVWSGGDDCKLKSWDLRDTTRPSFVNKNFDAGVTTITPSPHTPHLIAVGSYDSNLRLFDSRNARSPLLTIPTPGGIWRTRFHPSPERKGDVLLACMHGGFSVVRLHDSFLGSLGSAQAPATGEGSEHWSEIARFEEHASLAYGGDWSRLPPTPGGSLVGSCSFYDHALHLWRA